MANFDGGHYFLTILAPIKRDGFVDVEGGRRSHTQVVRDILSSLPTAQQSLASEGSGMNSPFTRVPGTHFARFVVIDDLRYNGRKHSDAIYDRIFSVKLSVPQKVDHLNHSYLLLAIDFDAASGDDSELRSYTDLLWQNMELELRTIFQHCLGFETVDNDASLFDYLKRCQVETTMPFNDYWIEAPPKPKLHAHMIAVSGLIAAAALGLYFGSLWTWGGGSLFGLTILVLLAVNLGLVVHAGLTPVPTAPHSDLKSVLKALYVQQIFVRFAIDNQDASDEELHQAFGRFCDEHKPYEIETPSQQPGVLRS